MKKHYLYLLIAFVAKTSLAANSYPYSPILQAEVTGYVVRNAHVSFNQYLPVYSAKATELVENIDKLSTVAHWTKEQLLPLTIALVYNAQSARFVLPSQQFYLDAPGEVIRLEAENEQLKKKNEFLQQQITTLKKRNEELQKDIDELTALED